ncbi:hypothetical protein NEOLEDRAFT_1244397 [Neolentinus lepideus HHB14362 ss-1]|uniref:Uncharacterized protein n=1 Tax=Neolentinus lepideus HHB14362 ss-1 TaxID=1314782 RepID=A0A165PXV3_9AGAM|nr:hypothetical protein NEOLEDRAFT_1244397 [Neolentinus lepideus HHB14362 ss-1]
MADPPKMSDPPFTPRKEFMPSQHIYSTFYLMTLSGSNLVRLYRFPQDFIRVLRKHLNDRQLLTATRQNNEETCYEYTVDGRPWASPKSIGTELLIVDLLQVVLRHGFNFLSTIDYGREHDDKVAIVFSKPQRGLDRALVGFVSSSTNLGRGPSPLPNGSSTTLAPLSPVGGHTQLSNEHRMIQIKIPFALSFPSANILRVISPPLNSTPAIIAAIRGSWPRGVVSEKKVGETFEFKLKGYKWFQEDTFATDSLNHILTILHSLDSHAFTLLTSLTLTSRSRAKDLWIFTGAGEVSEEQLEIRDSIIWPPGAASSILSHSNSHTDFQGGHPQLGSPLAGHRRLATLPGINANSEANGNGSPITPTAAYANGHGRSMTEPLPQIQTRQQIPLVQTVLRRHRSRTQWSQAEPANPPVGQSGRSSKPPPIDMTGVGAFTKPGHLRGLSLGGHPSPSIVYATNGGRRSSEDEETVVGGAPRAQNDRETFTFPNSLSPPSMFERRDPDLTALAQKPWVERSSAEIRNPFTKMFPSEKERGAERESSIRTTNQGPTRSRTTSSLSPGQELVGRRRSRLGSAPGPLVVQNPDPTPIEELRRNPMSPVGRSAPELPLPGGFGEDQAKDEESRGLNGFLSPPMITTTPPADERLSPPEFTASPSPPLSQSNGTPPATRSSDNTPSPPLLGPGAFRDSAFSTNSRQSGWTGTERSKSVEIPVKWTGPPDGEGAVKERVPSQVREEDGDGIMFPGGWADQQTEDMDAQRERDRAQSVPMSVTLGSDIDGTGTLAGLSMPGDRMSRSLDLPATEVERLRQEAKEVDARISSPGFEAGVVRKSSRGVVGMFNSRGMSVLSGMTTDSKSSNFFRQDQAPPMPNGGMGRGPARPSFGSNGGPPRLWLPKSLSIPAPLSQQPQPSQNRLPPAAQPQPVVRPPVQMLPRQPQPQPPQQQQSRVPRPKPDNIPSAAPQPVLSSEPLSPRKLQKTPSEEARKEREKQLGHQPSISEGWVWVNVDTRDAGSSQASSTPRGSEVKRTAGPSGLAKSAMSGDGRTRKVSHEKGGKGKFFLLGRKNNAGSADKKKLAKKAGPTEASQAQSSVPAGSQQRPGATAQRVGNGTSTQAQSRIPQRAGADQKIEPRSNYRPARPK